MQTIKKNTAAQTALMMAVLILLSKGLGFIREMVLAYFFGTTYITDAYVLATAIPTIIFGGVLGAVATAYMPLFSEKLEKEGPDSASRFTSQILSLLVAVATVSVLLGLLFSDAITAIFASGFSGETAQLTSYFVKITFSYVLFTSTSGILESYLQYKGIFLPQIAAGYLLNFAAIAVIAASSVLGYQYLPWGMLIGHLLKFLVTYLITRKHGYRFRPSLQLNAAVRRIALMTLPVFIGNSFFQINNFVDKTLATNLPTGSAAALNYGSLLVGLFTGLTTTVLTTILYPRLTQASTLKDQDRFREVLTSGISLICIITLPCSLGGMIYSREAVQLIFERGMFDAAATEFTATAFFYYSIGLVFTSISTFLTQTFYSRQNTRIPMLCNGICVLINIVLSIILSRYLAHGGLAFASSIAALLTAISLYLGLRQKYPEIIEKGKVSKLLKIVSAAAAAVVLSRMLYDSVLVSLLSSPLLMLAIAVLVAALLYLAILYTLKVEELKFLKQLLSR